MAHLYLGPAARTHLEAHPAWTKLRIAIARVAILIAALVSVLPAWQSDSRWGSIGYRLPQGWRAVQDSGLLGITPGNLPEGQQMIVALVPSRELSGDFRGQFDAWVQKTISSETSTTPGAVQRNGANGVEVLSQTISIGSGDSRQTWMFVGLKTGGRFESYVIIANPAALYRRYETQIGAIVESLTWSPPIGGGYPEAASNQTPPAPPVPQRYGAPRSQDPEPSPGTPTSLTPLQPRPGYAIGRVVDSNGTPLENAEVSVTRVLVPAGLYTYGATSTATVRVRNGRYEVPLQEGVYRVTAFANVAQAGQTYRLELQPLGGEDARETLPSAPGIVRDFTLATSGLRAGQQSDRFGTSNIGGSLQVLDGTFQMPPNTVAEVTLTPVGAGVGGGALPVIRRAQTMVFFINDIPLGTYQVAVRIGGQLRDFEIRDSDNSSFGRGPLVFTPQDAGVAGVKRMRLHVR